MVALLSDCRPAIRTMEKLDSGISDQSKRGYSLPSSPERAAPGHLPSVGESAKDIKGNEAADAGLSKRASIFGYESEGVMTPVGLRAEARGGAEMACWNGEEGPCQHTHGAGQIRGRTTGGYSG